MRMLREDLERRPEVMFDGVVGKLDPASADEMTTAI